MKQLGYYVFAGIYNLHRKFAKVHNKVVLFNGHNHGLNGNLELVSEEITKRDRDLASRISFIRTEGYVLRLREYCVFL